MRSRPTLSTVSRKSFRQVILYQFSNMFRATHEAVIASPQDFRVWTFDLQRSQFAVNLANNIFHFSRPASLTNFFQLSCGAVHPNSQQNDYKIAFNNRVDWQNEMERCWKMALSHWSFVCFDEQSVNEVPSYPFCVVVPNTLYGARIHESLIPNWNNGRFPVWCWSYTNGSAILRSSKCSNEMRSSELWNIVEHAICRSHPKNRLVSKIDVDISSSKIATSFDRLRELCAIDSMAQFKEREKDWYSLVDNTGWCALVFKCLLEARKVVNLVVDNQRSVVITDEDGLNASVVVCCLAQICADSYYRTIAGLNRLIEKEWIALGYPFGSNMFNCPFTSHLQQNRSSTATFLLFLDALSQLLRLFPVSFEYSQYMLIALWDLSITGLAPGLTCNSIRDRLLLKKTAPTFPLSQYYSSKYCIMFTNALYSTNILFGCEANTRDVIKPPASPLEVEFWTDCYLRWVPAANICEGGSVTHDVALSAVLAYTASAVCNSPSCESVVWRQRLHPAFDAKTVSF
ncbi:unnamed protein product [Anisakis simplex]|uniref:Myotubularin phosphatase domain-containing protein n=1 Tax=Anisakis simplex TaxID=6269 RepID=A0A158PN83_ANISI|nr:unnamed protein product [Anisakis simplex]